MCIRLSILSFSNNFVVFCFVPPLLPKSTSLFILTKVLLKDSPRNSNSFKHPKPGILRILQILKIKPTKQLLRTSQEAETLSIGPPRRLDSVAYIHPQIERRKNLSNGKKKSWVKPKANTLCKFNSFATQPFPAKTCEQKLR